MINISFVRLLFRLMRFGGGIIGSREDEHGHQQSNQQGPSHFLRARQSPPCAKLWK